VGPGWLRSQVAIGWRTQGQKKEKISVPRKEAGIRRTLKLRNQKVRLMLETAEETLRPAPRILMALAVREGRING